MHSNTALDLLVDHSAQPTNEQSEIRKKQLDYLKDLADCRIQTEDDSYTSDCIHDFIEEYPIPFPDDKNFILEMIKTFPQSLGKIPKEYFEDLEFVRWCIDNDYGIEWIPPKVCGKEIELVKKIVFKNPYAFNSLDKDVKIQIDTKELIKKWMELPDTTKYTFLLLRSSDLKALDRETLKEFIQRDFTPYHYAEQFADDREIALLLIKERRYFAKEMESQFDWKEDEEAFDALVNSKNSMEPRLKPKDFPVLKIAPQYQDDREFVMRIIDQDPSSYPFCSERLRGDKEIAMKALSQNSSLFSSVPKSLQEDRDVLMATLSCGGDFYSQLPENMKKEREVILAALTAQNSKISAARRIDKSYYNDKEIRDLIVKSGYLEDIDDFSTITLDQIKESSVNTYCEGIGNYFNKSTLNDCLQLVKHNHKVWHYWYEINDCPFIEELVWTYLNEPNAICSLPGGYNFTNFDKFKEFMRFDVNGKYYNCAPEEACSDRQFALHYLKHASKSHISQVFTNLSPELQTDPEIRKLAVKNGLSMKNFYIPLK